MSQPRTIKSNSITKKNTTDGHQNQARIVAIRAHVRLPRVHCIERAENCANAIMRNQATRTVYQSGQASGLLRVIIDLARDVHVQSRIGGYRVFKLLQRVGRNQMHRHRLEKCIRAVIGGQANVHRPTFGIKSAPSASKKCHHQPSKLPRLMYFRVLDCVRLLAFFPTHLIEAGLKHPSFDNFYFVANF